MSSGYFDREVIGRAEGEGSGKKRPQRVGDMIRNELALLLLRKMKDPRLKNVTIVHVGMSKDLRQANIYYSVFGSEDEARQAAAGLDSAKGFIRSHIARELGMRFTPQLTFRRDFSAVRQEEMERLFKELNELKEEEDAVPESF